MYSKWSVSLRKPDIYWHWICDHAEILFQIPKPEKSTIRGFLKIDHSSSTARIVSEQNKFSKKVTHNRDWTLWLWYLFFLLHCLKDWDFNIFMLCSFQLNHLKSKSPLMHKRKWSYPQINTCQDSSVWKAWDFNSRITKVLLSQVQSLL